MFKRMKYNSTENGKINEKKEKRRENEAEMRRRGWIMPDFSGAG